jgi:hypothetical protein
MKLLSVEYVLGFNAELHTLYQLCYETCGITVVESQQDNDLALHF